MTKAEVMQPERETGEAITNLYLKITYALIQTGAIEAIERHPGYRIHPDKMAEVMSEVEELMAIKNSDGEIVKGKIADAEAVEFGKVVRSTYRYMVTALVDSGVVTADLVFIAGMLNRPSTIKLDFSFGGGPSHYNPAGPNPLAAYILGTIGEMKQQQKMLICDFPEDLGIELSAMDSFYANAGDFEVVKQVLDEEGLELDQDEIGELVLVRTVAHEYGHVLSEAKVYSNIIEKIVEKVNLEGVSGGPQRLTAIVKALGWRNNEFFDKVINRVYMEEESLFQNWVYQKGAPMAEVLGDQSKNKRIRLSSEERIAVTTSEVAFEKMLMTILDQRGIDYKRAFKISERVREIVYSRDQADFKAVVSLMKEKNFSLEVVDRALKEVNRRTDGKGLGWYNLSATAGYMFPFSEDELIRVLGPMSVEMEE